MIRLLCLLSLIAPVGATTFHISTKGADSNNGGEAKHRLIIKNDGTVGKEQPWITIKSVQ